MGGTNQYDACVVGAGITGVSVAVRLAKAGRSVVLVDAATVGSGASGNSAGHCVTGGYLLPSDLAAIAGDTETLVSLKESHRAKLELRSSLIAHGFGRYIHNGYALFGKCDADGEQLARTCDYWERAGLDGLGLSVRSEGEYSGISVLHDPSSFSVAPEVLPKFFRRLLAPTNVVVHENWAVVDVKPGVVSSLRGVIRAAQVIVCAGLGTERLIGAGEPQRQSWTTVAKFGLSTGSLASVKRFAAAGADCSPEPDYFTALPETGQLLFGISHNALLDPNTARSELRARLAALFPGVPFEAIGLPTTWPVDHSDDDRPIIKQPNHGVFVAYGYSGAGLVEGFSAGETVARRVIAHH